MLPTVLVYGILWTAINSLIAIGFYLIFSVAQILNLAHGMIIVGGCYAVYVLAAMVKLPLAVSVVGGILSTVLILLIIYLCFIKRLFSAPHSSMLLVTAGLAMIMEQIIILTVGPDTKFVPSMVTGSSKILGVGVSNQGLLTVCIAFSVIALLMLFLKHTKEGRAIRATSQDRDVAVMSGINIEEIYWMAVIIAGMLAGIAGVLVAPIQTLTPKAGWEMMITAFTATILGGLGGPIWGVVLAAAIVAFIELFTAFMIGPAIKEAAAFLILILTLMFKPSGLFGKRRA